MTDITGATETAAAFDRLAAQAGPVTDRLTQGAARRVEERTRATVTVLTGRTQRSVSMTRNGNADYSVGGDKAGTLKRLELGGSKGGAQPALYPAADAEAPEWRDDLANGIKAL